MLCCDCHWSFIKGDALLYPAFSLWETFSLGLYVVVVVASYTLGTRTFSHSNKTVSKRMSSEMTQK